VGIESGEGLRERLNSFDFPKGSILTRLFPVTECLSITAGPLTPLSQDTGKN